MINETFLPLEAETITNNLKKDILEYLPEIFISEKTASTNDDAKVNDARGGMLKQSSPIIQGIDRDISQEINKCIKNSKLKVQVAIRGDELRVTSNKRDLLQTSIQMIKDLEIKQPLQFINFRD